MVLLAIECHYKQKKKNKKNKNKNKCHYLPHRVAIVSERETTKIHIVFDASAECKGFP